MSRRSSPVVFLAALAIAAPAAAQPRALAGAPPALGGVVRVDLSQPGARQSISIPRGKSATIEFTSDVREAQVTNPQTADVRVHTPRRISILGLNPGQTDAAFFDSAGRRVLTLDIRVDQDVAALNETLSRVSPGSNVKVEAINDSIILTGVVESMAEADAIVQTARLFVAKPENVLNRLTVTGKDQVMLKVRIVEVQRNVIKQFGVDLNAVIGQAGGDSFNFVNTASFAVNGGQLGGLQGAFDADNLVNPQRASGVVRAFERAGLLRTLAEPTMTAVSGEPAKFLAGGEYPVPSGIDQQGRVVIEFKPYGVGLGFTPVVLSGGRIALKLSTEVSELTTQGAYTFTGNTGQTLLTVPALTVRRAETSIELPSGGSMMIGGLLREQTRQNIDKVPGISDIPVFGALSRSRDFLAGETELVVVVTAYLVKPVEAGVLQTPADGLRIANDAQTLLLGRLNDAHKTAPSALAGRTYVGAFGHVIE